jgi:hypothetical protein
VELGATRQIFLPSVILETKTFNEAIRAENLNPFEQPKIIICSFQFARSKEPYLRTTPWNLVVIDEARRLRNVYKPGNKVAYAIKQALTGHQKLLLTATPLQNSLLELYSLVSIVDGCWPGFGGRGGIAIDCNSLARLAGRSGQRWVDDNVRWWDCPLILGGLGIDCVMSGCCVWVRVLYTLMLEFLRRR